MSRDSPGRSQHLKTLGVARREMEIEALEELEGGDNERTNSRISSSAVGKKPTTLLSLARGNSLVGRVVNCLIFKRSNAPHPVGRGRVLSSLFPWRGEIAIPTPAADLLRSHL